jgi:hypothetical protein
VCDRTPPRPAARPAPPRRQRCRRIEVFGPVGTKVRIDGQEYELVRTEPHLWKTGATMSAIWTSHCADCGAPIVATTPLGSLGLRRRCEQHFAPGKRVVAVLAEPMR